MKDYISITSENCERILRLDCYECAVFILLALSADEDGFANAMRLLLNHNIPLRRLRSVIESLEEKRFIKSITEKTVKINNWEDYQL